MIKSIYIFIFLLLGSGFFFNDAIARVIESNGNGNWTTASSWIGNSVPTNGDTVIILSGDIITISSNINNNDYLFIVIRGTLDLSSNGKLKIGGASVIIIELGGKVLGDGSQDQIQIGSGNAEWDGSDGNISGPTWVENGHSPSLPTGTGLPPGYIPLPVDLTSFTAASTENSVILSWITASEQNNDYFTLERSRNGKGFEIIGQVEGNGTTNLESKYSFTDSNPYLGLSYYRLSQTDYDGQFEVFPAISVLFTHEKSNFSIYPNPMVDQSVRMKVSGKGKNEKLTLNIIDPQGKRIEQKTFSADFYGNLETELLLSHPIQNGLYIFELISETGHEYLKVAGM